MPKFLALALGLAFIAVLLRNERARRPDVSAATWIPTIWLLLCGSKPLGRWFDIGGATNEEVGSPADRLVLSIVIALALVVLTKRRVRWSVILQENIPLVLLFLYLGMTVVWSDFPLVSFKRWIRLCGAIPVALVLVTERSPLQALESVLRRCAYVLLPLSLVLIKYFTDYGVQYDQWVGTGTWVGVAPQKNSFGVICSISAFLIVWAYVRDWKTGVFFKNRSFALTDGLVLALALFLLNGFDGQYPATAIGFLLAGVATLLLVSRLKGSLKAVATAILLMVTIALVSLTFFESVVLLVTGVFHRDPTFTGRTPIWEAVRTVAARTPLQGVGFGGYWGLRDEEIFSKLLVHESHSGYLDVYLETGLVGGAFVMVFLIAFYRRALNAVKEMPEWGWFGICLLIMTLIHNFTESNFLRTSSYFWNSLVFVSLAFASSAIRARMAAELPRGKSASYATARRPVGPTGSVGGPVRPVGRPVRPVGRPSSPIGQPIRPIGRAKLVLRP
jgi:O-antigen ligase